VEDETIKQRRIIVLEDWHTKDNGVAILTIKCAPKAADPLMGRSLPPASICARFLLGGTCDKVLPVNISYACIAI